MKLSNGQMERGIGVCTNEECCDHFKDVFLMGHRGPTYQCSRCMKIGRRVMEVGETDNDFSLDFYQVQVEFSYNPALDEYRNVAIVTDETMSKEGNVYVLKSPLIKTEKRALLVAESLLGSLMRADDSIFAKGYLVRDQINQIDFDKPFSEVKSQLDATYEMLLNSRLRKSDNG